MRTNRIKYISALFFFTCLLFPHIPILKAQPKGYTAVTNEEQFSIQLNKFTSDLQTIQAEFTQEKHLQYLETGLKSKGMFWFKSPNSVRWEYHAPYEYILLLNDGKLKMISESSSNEFDTRNNEMFKQVNDMILGAVSGKIYQQDNYDINTFENNDRYLVVLKPSADYIKELIDKIELYFDKKNYTVVEIKMIEVSNDYTVIRFSNQLINEILPENIFSP
ncbi:MAG: outer membrane lipoprotein carrier protein LolA [Bacteroidales bacterium]|nr:outer membrane lipoprotein carrier protein LolA [Bacteroidales bacterium]